jgi:hypothetical protein
MKHPWLVGTGGHPCAEAASMILYGKLAAGNRPLNIGEGENTNMIRIFAYRVYFTIDPETYYVVGACNVRRAIRRAKRSWRAFAISHKNRRLKACKVERLYKGADVRELKIASCEPPRAARRSVQPCQPQSSPALRMKHP